MTLWACYSFHEKTFLKNCFNFLGFTFKFYFFGGMGGSCKDRGQKRGGGETSQIGMHDGKYTKK